MADDKPVEEDEELLDYEEEEVAADEGAGAKSGEAVKKGYVGIHSTGFRDFLLKPELLRAIVDCGFEHPSEGTLRRRPRVCRSPPARRARFARALQKGVGDVLSFIVKAFGQCRRSQKRLRKAIDDNGDGDGRRAGGGAHVDRSFFAFEQTVWRN